ncbi:MAG: cytochrome c [Acidobacteriales bacterium]|nr:cytochrome c [Terriglobales bacterium]
MTNKWSKAGLAAGALALLLLAGCRQDMHDQPKYIPLRESRFFADGQSARQPVEHAVARGHLQADKYFYTGKIGDGFGNDLPQGLLKEGYGLKDLLHRGQGRFNIYCAPCHAQIGNGNGAVALRGFQKMPASFHDPRLKAQNLGYFFDVMTNGFGAMLNYKAQIPPEDRWAIAAYIRALQLSQDATLADVPESEREHIKDPMTSKPGSPAPAKAEPKKGGAH